MNGRSMKLPQLSWRFSGLACLPFHAVSFLLNRQRNFAIFKPRGFDQGIGQIAADARVKKLVLSHRMLHTLGRESQTESEIRKRYPGPLQFADDLDCFPIK
jgi:hypothetical protein